MAFNFAQVAAEAANNWGFSDQGIQVVDGDELKEIQTGQLGFKTINGETKIKLLPSPWPPEEPPIPSAQLLSVASSQEILAAAGPDTLVIASTSSIREELSKKEGENIRDVAAILKIPHYRLTHVAFSADESVLVVSGPSIGGLIAYQVDKLKSGQAEIALKISVATPLSTLVPNPNPTSANLFAVVDAGQQLSIADFSTGQLVKAGDSDRLATSVTCVSWSNRGKQLIAGMINGTAAQLKPDGKVVAQIPKSTSIPSEAYISTISWLEDDTFFIIYTPNLTSAEDGIPPSEYYIVERSNKTQFTFHKLPEILPPFGVERLPTHHFISRLRKFDPYVTDLLLLTATTATDVGIITKTSQPLSVSDNAEDLVTNAFTMTSLEDDTRRAALPLSADSPEDASPKDTSPIGMAIDLSSKEPVINPIATDPEIQESAGPVPNLLVLNNEGLLCSWWVIYSDSIRQKTTFSGFEILRAIEDVRSVAPPPDQGKLQQQSLEPVRSPSHAFTTVNPLSQSSQPTKTTISSSPFGIPAQQTPFGAPKLQTPTQSGFGTGSGFGTSSKIGENKPSWTSTGFSNTTNTGSAFGQSTFGQPAFGTPSAATQGNAPTFGTTTAFGNRPSTFGQAAAPTFGQPIFGASSTASPFASASGSGAGSGFASFATSGGFTTGSEKAANQSPFSKPSTGGGFGSFAQAASTDSPFSKATGSSVFGQPTAAAGFGTGKGFSAATPFKIGSSFKGDGTAKDDLPRPLEGGGFNFGSTFENMLGESNEAVSEFPSKEAEMDDSESDVSVAHKSNDKPFARFLPTDNKSALTTKAFTTPPSTITQPKSNHTPPVSSLFASIQQQSTTPQQPFSGFSLSSTTPKETPAASHTIFGTKPIIAPTPAIVQKSEPMQSFGATGSLKQTSNSVKPESSKTDEDTKIKTEFSSDDEVVDLKSIPLAPLPPDPISKPDYTTGDTSASSANSKESKELDDAPLPPDFLPANASASKESVEAHLPDDEDDGDADEYSDDFEDSGEDVTQDVSPSEDAEEDQDNDEEATTDHIQTSPESSFKGGETISPTGGLFTKVSNTDALKSNRPLFGEVGRPAPMFAPPKPQQSPRSPSPVRPLVSHDTMRPDVRSVSAPLHHRSAIDQRKNEYAQSPIALQAARAREEESAREKVRLESTRLAAEKAKLNELQVLEDDEDERIHRELAQPVRPSENLDEFITFQAASNHTEIVKPDIPAQIERLYQDINSMICTLGINARSLSSFILHQQIQPKNSAWPQILNSSSPLDALHESWSLTDIRRLHEGTATLVNNLENIQVQGIPRKLESCQNLLTKDLFDLRTKLTLIRKSLHGRAHGFVATAPLSAEQTSIQHDLRKASASIQTRLVEVEDTLAVIRARLTEIDSAVASGSHIHIAPKKPTVEAVTNTVSKMTLMAEKRSADVDVLEAQLKRLEVSLSASITSHGQTEEPATPHRSKISHTNASPGSVGSSVFYTPDSKAVGSTKSTRSIFGKDFDMTMVSADDKDRWLSKARRRKEVAATLRTVLEDKRKKATTSA